jgi:transcriptional regulator with XRE-family HTH domain
MSSDQCENRAGCLIENGKLLRKIKMDLALVIRHRLKELGLEQRGLAAAAHVTESYVSQLLGGRKAPPAPERTDVYSKMEEYLRLPGGELAKLAGLHRVEQLKKRIADPPRPLFKEFRELIYRKCSEDRCWQVREIFEKEPFGELERLVTQKLLDVAKDVAREELESENWLRMVARLSQRSYEQMRVMILEFLDTDVFHISIDNWVSFMDPLIESWDIDLESFSMEIVLDRRLTLGHLKRFDFVEHKPEQPFQLEAGFEEFLRDAVLSAGVTDEEIEFLKRQRFAGRHPTALYYYRALQSLRDPLHFKEEGGAPGSAGWRPPGME